MKGQRVTLCSRSLFLFFHFEACRLLLSFVVQLAVLILIGYFERCCFLSFMRKSIGLLQSRLEENLPKNSSNDSFLTNFVQVLSRSNLYHKCIFLFLSLSKRSLLPSF